MIDNNKEMNKKEKCSNCDNEYYKDSMYKNNKDNKLYCLYCMTKIKKERSYWRNRNVCTRNIG